MKIDKAELEQFRQTLPEGIQNEYFNWIATRYSVATALFIIHKQQMTPGNINVATWAKALQLDGPKQEEDATSFTINLFNGVQDKDALRDMINPEIPIIIAEHEFGRGKKKESVTIVIDGNKRLRKSFLQNRINLAAYYLPKNLAKLCIL